MKPTSQTIFLTLAIAVAMASAHSQSVLQSPREQLTQLVQQLQKAPTDNALREQVIRLGATLKPSPAVPDAAVAFEGRAQFAFRTAKSEEDFVVAAGEYEKALAVAPWVPGHYADLCTIYEKAGRFEAAKRHCGFYLMSLSDPAQINDVKRRIAGLAFGIEKANSLRTAKASKPSGPDFSGCWQGRDLAGTQYCDFSFERNGDSWIVRDSGRKPLSIVRTQGRQIWIDDEEMGIFTRHYALILSEDGQTIETTQHDTQSPDQRRRYEAKFPGSRLSALNVPVRYTQKKRK